MLRLMTRENTQPSGRSRDLRQADADLPLCVFGPGGDYRTAWIPETSKADGCNRLVLRVGADSVAACCSAAGNRGVVGPIGRHFVGGAK